MKWWLTHTTGHCLGDVMGMNCLQWICHWPPSISHCLWRICSRGPFCTLSLSRPLVKLFHKIVLTATFVVQLEKQNELVNTSKKSTLVWSASDPGCFWFGFPGRLAPQPGHLVEWNLGPCCFWELRCNNSTAVHMRPTAIFSFPSEPPRHSCSLAMCCFLSKLGNKHWAAGSNWLLMEVKAWLWSPRWKVVP